MRAINDDNPVLTISLLSSSRKDTIRKCLDSLETLRSRVPSELIVVDTGHDEEVLEILKEYTDKIVPFTWCNDFSKARNAGLDKAKGQWFLYLDDDEWFIDTKEIEEFFLSGEHKKYTLAYYIIRNFDDMQGQRYADARVSRMFRLWNNVRFKGIIHEYPDPLIGESVTINSIAEHYGYVHDTEEKRYLHAQRNIPLIQEMLKKDKKNTRWWIQLVQEYRSVRRFTELKDCCRDAIREFRNVDVKEVNIARGTFYNGWLDTTLRLFEYDAADKVLKEALADRRNTPLCMARLYISGSNIAFRKEDYALCQDYCEKFLEIFGKMKDDRVAIYDQGYFYVEEAFSQKNVEQMYCRAISSGLRRKERDTGPLERYFYELNWEGESLFLDEFLIPDMLDAFAELPYDEAYVQMAETVLKRAGADRTMIENLQKREDGDEESFGRLKRIFLQTQKSHPYLDYLKFLEISSAEELRGFLGGRSLYALKSMTDYLCGHAGADVLEEKRRLLESVREEFEAFYEYYLFQMSEAGLLGCDKEDYNALHTAVEAFCEHTLAFYDRYFKEAAFEGEMLLLPLKGRIAVRFSAVLKAERQGDVKEISSALKQCMKVCPEFDGIVKAYTDLYAERQKRLLAQQEAEENVEAKRISLQMRQLGAQVKSRIRFLLKENLIAEAQEALGQLKPLLPDDPEIAALEEQIHRSLS